MADLPESSVWTPSIYELATTDPVQGGPIAAGTGEGGADHAVGISNLQAKQLADRTLFLKNSSFNPIANEVFS